MRPTLPYVRSLGALVLGATLLLSHAREAFAQGPTIVLSHYVVVTKDGSTYQGELVENVVGGHVTLRLATGEIVTFDARDIQSQGSATTTPSVPVLAPLPAPPPAPPSARRPSFSLNIPGLYSGTPRAYEGADAVAVHITSPNDANASLAQESASGWVTVCQIPCTTTVDPKAMYQLQTMPGLMVPSAPFRFPADEGALELNANVRSRLHNMGWGIGLVTGGPLVALPGIYLLSGMFDSGGSPSTGETVLGWTLVGVSTALVITGVVMLAMPASSTMTDANGHRIAKADGVHLTPTGLVF
jgi:hypothetical protein